MFCETFERVALRCGPIGLTCALSWRRPEVRVERRAPDMRVRPELDPDVNDEAPDGPDITVYDEAHFVTYLRLLDAERDGAHWTEVARIVLHRDPDREEARTRRCFESHLARAQWMTKRGYRRLLEQSVEQARRSRS